MLDAPFHCPPDIPAREIDRARRRFDEFFIPEPMSGCWLWLGGVSWQGYGKFHFRTTMAAHRASWALHHRVFPEVNVLHRCDNPACVNPEHLFLGSHLDNMRDKARKGRQFRPRGELNGQAKLSNAEVIRMRALHADGIEQKDIAAQFGLAQSAVSNIVNRKTYAHVE